MADSQKGATSASCAEKNSLLDEDFGSDFLRSWSRAEVGKEATDFDVEAAPRNGKKSFNFDKLDDFELGGDFGKLSSFKMDMSELDFSSPVKKTEKTTEKSSKEFLSGKQEPKNEKFSFTFDFNELDKFDLDSKLLKGEKKLSKCMGDIGPDCSIKFDMDIDSRSNSVMNSDETKIIPNKENTTTSKPAHLTEPGIVENVNPSISNLWHHDVCPEAQTSSEKKIVIGKHKNETHSIKQHVEQSDGKCPIKPTAEKAAQDFTLLSVSGDQAKLPQTQGEFVSLDFAEDNTAREQESSMRSLDSLQSWNSSPSNSYHSNCWMIKNKTESSDTSHKFQKQEGSQSEVSGASTSSSESNQDQKDVENSSVSEKHPHATKSTGEKPHQRSKFLPLPLHGVSGLVQTMPIKEKGASALQLKSVNISAGSLAQPTSASTPKHLHGLQNKKIEIMHLYAARVKRESKPNDKLAQSQEGGMLRSFDASLKTSVPSISKSGRSNKDNNTSRFQFHFSNLHGRTTASNDAKNITPNIVPGYAPVKDVKDISFEGKDVTPKDDKNCDISGMMTSRITRAISRIPNPTTQKETKSVKVLEGNLTLKVANTVITEKQTLLSPPLKRKILEEAEAGAKTLKPLKCVMESSTERRKPSEVSPKVDKMVALESQKLESLHSNVSVDSQTSLNGVPEVGRTMDFEVPVLLENDGNVEKAEGCAKELDGICNMLKKKHEEAKELLVRAMVNNNALLMLNHPMFEEKIRALQRFAKSLQSKEH